MTYYLVIFPGPTKIMITRQSYEVASRDEAPTVTIKDRGSFLIKEKCVFQIESLDAAFVVAIKTEKIPARGRDYLKK